MMSLVWGAGFLVGGIGVEVTRLFGALRRVVANWAG